MKTENISTLKIHKLSQEQYERELVAGNIDENALYFTPDTGGSSTGGGITEIPSEYITESELEAKGYLTTTSADSKYQPKGTYLTSVPSEYITETELNAKGYLTQHQDLSSYAKKTDIPTVPTKVSQLTNDSGYLTSVPSEYVTESELNNLPKGNVVYATCETAAATAAKVVTVSSSTNWSLSVGSVVMVYFTTSNSASNVTLNVNGSGAYPIWYNNAEYTSTGTAYTGYAKRVINYMFNGTHWVWIGASYDSNTTYKNVSLGHGYATCDTAEATAAKVGTLASYALTLGGIVAVKFTYAVPANATLNINSKGAKNIFYRGAKITANVIKAGDIATFIYDGTQYQLLSIDRWQNDIDAISEEIGNKQPKGNYALKSEIPSVDGLASETYVDGKANELSQAITNHENDTTKHITSTERGQWNKNTTDIVTLNAEIENLDKKIGQISPTFVSSIEECVDTDKVYVLPDGYIYSYTTKTVTTIPTNQIKKSIVGNGDNTIYNGKGWKTGSALRADTGAENTSYTSYETTGFIRVNPSDIVRIKNFTMHSTATAYNNIGLYDSNFAILGAFTQASSYNPLSQFITDGVFEGSFGSPTKTNISASNLSSIAYIRLSFWVIDDTTILTINEPLEPTTTTSSGWYSTGVKFVADDNTERVDDLENRVSILEQSGVESVASYVQEEAKRVAKRVYSHQNANTFTFLAISDMHYIDNYSNIAQSLIHAGKGMDLVRKYTNVDFATCLGDNGWGSGVEGSQYRATIEMGIEEIRSANACIDSAFRGIPNFRSVGNHDSLVYNYTFNNNDYLDAQELFPLYGAYNRGAIFQEGNRERGYCYRDFDDWKLRVICMNTSDLKDLSLPTDMAKDVCISGTQGKWFAETIDLSSKENAEEWSILILSHAPLDFGSRCIYLCDILKAYLNGTSVSLVQDGVTISYNYAGKNKATIIGNCHGHNHNFQVDNLRRFVSGSTTEPINLKRFGIPNACFERTNEKGENSTPEVWDIEYGESTSYEKVVGTAQDTSFCVITIDTIAHKIYADCYGAGYDRVIDY